MPSNPGFEGISCLFTLLPGNDDGGGHLGR